MANHPDLRYRYSELAISKHAVVLRPLPQVGSSQPKPVVDFRTKTPNFRCSNRLSYQQFVRSDSRASHCNGDPAKAFVDLARVNGRKAQSQKLFPSAVGKEYPARIEHHTLGD